MRKLFLLTLICLLCLSSSAYCQTEQVKNYLHLVASGKLDEVKKALPDLLAEYPDDPGVQLLHATVIDDAFLAVEKYKSIIKNHPESQWADDAYWRIVQFYAVLGDLDNARKELDNYRKKYPDSEFLIAATDVVRAAEINKRKTEKSDKTIKASENKDKTMSEEMTAKPKEYAKQEAKTKTLNDSKQTKTSKTAKETKPVKDSKTVKSTKVTGETKLITGKNLQKDVKITEAKPEAKKKTIAEAKPDDGSSAKMEKVELKKHETIVTDGSKYGLQVGVYSTKDAADLEVKKFKSQRMLAEILKKEVDGESMFAVVIGDYSSRESAEAAKNIVTQQCKCSPIVFKK